MKRKATHSEVPPLPEPTVVEPEPYPEPVVASASVVPEAPKPEEKPAALDRGVRAALADSPPKSAKDIDKPSGRKMSPLFVGGSSLALLAAVAGGYMMSRGTGGANPDAAPIVLPTADPAAPAAEQMPAIEALPAAAKTLADDARRINAPAGAIDALVAVGDALTPQVETFRAMANDPAQADAARGKADALRKAAAAGAVAFATALRQQTETTARKLSRDVPWANATNIDSTRSDNADRRSITVQLRDALAGVQSATTVASAATDPGQAFGGARAALGQWQIFSTAAAAAYRAPGAARVATVAPAVKAEPVAKAPKAAAVPIAAVVEVPEPSSSSGGVSPAKMSQFQSIVSEANAMASDVMRSGSRENATLARGYNKYLGTLKNSMRGADSDRDADRLITSAKQTRAYLVFLQKQTSSGR